MKRAGLVGVGNIALDVHLPGWLGRGDVRVVAATDTRDDHRARIEESVPGLSWYPSFEEMVSSGALDFVDIATSPSTHAALASAALTRGLHVLCEKPLVVRVEDVPPLAALAREKERALVTVHDWKYAPVVAKAADLVRQGAVGAVTRVVWKSLRTKPTVLPGGGILVGHGWHALYVVLGWLPEPPKRVSATLETRMPGDSPLEDTATVRLECGGTRAEILLTWASEEQANRVEITGTRGRLRLDGGRLALFQTPSSLRSPSGPAGDWKFPSLAEGSHYPEWFDGVIEELFGEMEDPARRGQNLKEAALCAEIIDLARESGRRGGEALEVKGLA